MPINRATEIALAIALGLVLTAISLAGGVGGLGKSLAQNRPNAKIGGVAGAEGSGKVWRAIPQVNGWEVGVVCANGGDPAVEGNFDGQLMVSCGNEPE
jgi:hypothetical protein